MSYRQENVFVRVDSEIGYYFLKIIKTILLVFLIVYSLISFQTKKQKMMFFVLIFIIISNGNLNNCTLYKVHSNEIQWFWRSIIGWQESWRRNTVIRSPQYLDKKEYSQNSDSIVSWIDPPHSFVHKQVHASCPLPSGPYNTKELLHSWRKRL